jgi:hypothetical protein
MRKAPGEFSRGFVNSMSFVELGVREMKTTNVLLPDRDVRRRVKAGCGMGSVRVQALLFVCRGCIMAWEG